MRTAFKNYLESQSLPASLIKRFAKGTAWSLFGTTGAQIIGLFTNIALARVLGKTFYGEYAAMLGTVIFLSEVGGFGLVHTLIKYIAELRETDKLRSGKLLGLAFCAMGVICGSIAIGMIIFAQSIATNIFNSPHLLPAVRLTAIWLFFNTLINIESAILSGFEAFRYSAILQLTRAILNISLVVFGAAQFGAFGALSMSVVVWIFIAAIGLRLVQTESRKFNIKINFKAIASELPILRTFALPSFVAAATYTLGGWIPTVILSHQPNGYGEIAVFNASIQWRQAILLLPNAAALVLLPIFTDLQRQADHTNYKNMIRYGAIINGSVALLGAILISIFSGWIMSFYGAGFIEGKSTLILFVFGAAIGSVTAVFGQIFASKGKVWEWVLMNATWALSAATLSWIWREQGSFGIALSFLVAHILHITAIGVYFQMRLKEKAKS